LFGGVAVNDGAGRGIYMKLHLNFAQDACIKHELNERASAVWMRDFSIPSIHYSGLSLNPTSFPFASSGPKWCRSWDSHDLLHFWPLDANTLVYCRKHTLPLVFVLYSIYDSEYNEVQYPGQLNETTVMHAFVLAIAQQFKLALLRVSIAGSTTLEAFQKWYHSVPIFLHKWLEWN